MEIALLGNPNTGKTSLFNKLTGTYEYVGNWSGVTVEKKVGLLKNKSDKLIDFPGIYTLTPLSKDEGIVTHHFLYDKVEKCINILDASQLKRNLHLTIQLLEFGVPLVIGLNMVDVARNRGINVDPNKLSKILGVPVTLVMARTGEGCDTLTELIQKEISEHDKLLSVYYGKEIEQSILKFEKLLEGKTTHSVRWLTLQLLEGNKYVHSYLCEKLNSKLVEEFIHSMQDVIMNKYKETSLEHFIYQQRNKAIDQLMRECVIKEKGNKVPFSEKMDNVVTNQLIGIPIFLICMYLIFMITFDWLGFPLSDKLDSLISGPITNGIDQFLIYIGISEFIHRLIIDGIVAGVGGVIVFVPQIFILFFFISLLEDSGYMARVALVMDRTMEKVGLNGKAFIPMIIGFGCNVPGIMAARTIDTPKERILTILLTPLMSCSARLPVYTLFVGAFFIQQKALIVLSLYVLGIALALILAKIFSVSVLKGETTYFVMELPPYRVPQFQALWRSTWDKGKGFIKKAGTFIFAGSVFIWLLSFMGPQGLNVNMDESYLAAVGGLFAPLLSPLGFGTWQASASLLTGFFAKEAVVSTMSIIYFVPEGANLQGLLSGYYSALSAYSFMAFILLYIPCLATTATIYKETGSKRWTLFSIVYALFIAYILCLIIYQGGRLLGLG